MSSDERARALDFRPSAGVTTSVAFSPDGKLLLTASDEHPPRLWDVDTGRLLLEPGRTPYLAHDNENSWSPAYFSPNGQFIVAGRGDLLSIFDGRPLNRIRERLSDPRDTNR